MNGNSGSVSKNALREEILKARSHLTRDEREAKNSAIFSRLVEMPEFDRARLVMAYMDFRDEAGTARIIEECFRRGKRVALPAVIGKIGTASGIRAFETIPGAGFVKGSYGISEPDPVTAVRVEEAEIDLVIVPGVVFDLSKYRIGYGAGYYDRFLVKLRKDCVTVGIAYELQVVDAIPVEDHDIPVDKVVTERRII